MNSLPTLDAIETAIDRLARRFQPPPLEMVPPTEMFGRVLAAPLLADRDSPAAHVSAMDGFAIRSADLNFSGPIPVAGVAQAGQPPRQLPAGKAIKIFTGAVVPHEADLVVKREDVRECDSAIEIAPDVAAQQAVKRGLNIRFQGENTKAGSTVLAARTLVDSTNITAIASFAPSILSVFRKLRVAVINTGDELFEPGSTVAPWQIRNSNGPLLAAWIRTLPWTELVSIDTATDSLAAISTAIEQALQTCDALLLTGGVSMGDTDYVPAAIEKLGGDVAFHRLPIRPGKPILGASLAGKLILALPGNPVSVAVTSRLFGLPLLQRLAGMEPLPAKPLAQVHTDTQDSLPIIWNRLVYLNAAGEYRLVPSRGSGDVMSLSQSCGFVTLAPNQTLQLPVPFTAW